MTGATERIPRSAVTNGGGLLASASYKLNAALAEAVVSSFTGASLRMHSGYMPLAAQPGTVTGIVAVSKTTGTIELSWTAPGMDGFVGDVAGFYRIDWSSETSHVFDPTVYETEFSTSVSPGELQVHTITGLEPNTTYFARVYLADARKVVSETSHQSEDSTLARLPVSPVVSAVYESSITFTWNLPADGAAGFNVDASSTDFAGGLVRSSATHSGTQTTLLVTGLYPDTTYYFRLGSLNWQDDYNFTTLIATRTRSGGPQPIESLAVSADARGRRVRFTWINPPSSDLDGVLVQVSTQPITSGAANGVPYADGDVFPDSSMVADDDASDEHEDEGLSLNTTYYYRFYSKNTSDVYSVHVATLVYLDLPPMAPAGMYAELNADRTQMTIRWQKVVSHSDGTGFADPDSLPYDYELSYYSVYRATGIVGSSWFWVQDVPMSGTECTVSIPDPNKTYFYKVESRDIYGDKDVAMVMDSKKNLYALGPDQVTRLRIPASMTDYLRSGGSGYGLPMLAKAEERASEVGGRVVKAVRFDLQDTQGNVHEDFVFPKPELGVTLRYEVQGGQVVNSAYVPQQGSAVAAKIDPAVEALDATQWLGSYWFNGSEYVKLFGDVDPAEQTVTVNTALPGDYQIRTVYRPSDFVMDITQVSNKVITPNGDGRNDLFTVTLSNPQDSGISGQIFDVRGAHVADMTPGAQVANSLVWDGRSNGKVVPRGVYIFQVKGEDKVFNGTVLVIR